MLARVGDRYTSEAALGRVTGSSATSGTWIPRTEPGTASDRRTPRLRSGTGPRRMDEFLVVHEQIAQ